MLASHYACSFCNLSLYYLCCFYYSVSSDQKGILIIQMSLQQSLKFANEQVQTGSLADLARQLNQISNISKNQIQGNETLARKQLSTFVRKMRQNIKRNKRDIYKIDLRPLLLKLNNNLPGRMSQLKSQLSLVNRQVQNLMVQSYADQQIQEQQNLVKTVLLEQSQKQPEPLKVTFIPKKTPVIFENPNNVALQPFSSLLSQRLPMMTTPSQVPQAIKVLSNFVRQQNKIGIGQISQQQGLSYVGLSKINVGFGPQQIVPYQQNQIQNTRVPNIPVQLKYHINKTINSWNNYVGQQSKFIRILNQVATQDRRTQYLQKQIYSLNVQTFTAQVLASLTFYYVYLPLQKFIKYAKGTTEKQFYQHYEVGGSFSTNPILLNKVVAVEVAKILLNNEVTQFKDPSFVYAKIRKIFTDKTIKTGLNRRQFQAMQMYPEQKTLQARSFFQNSGISSNQYQKLLATDHFQVKQKKMYVNNQRKNNKIVLIINKITQLQNEGDKETRTKWDYNWQSSQIAAHDYIWKMS